MSLQLRTVKGRNDRSNFNSMQLILETQRQRATAAGGYVICLQLCQSLKEITQTYAGNCDIIKDSTGDIKNKGRPYSRRSISGVLISLS